MAARKGNCRSGRTKCKNERWPGFGHWLRYQCENWSFSRLADTKQVLAAPRLISNLSGSAFECFRERDPGAYRHADVGSAGFAIPVYTRTGTIRLARELLASHAQEQKRRDHGFYNPFETTLSKVEELIAMNGSRSGSSRMTWPRLNIGGSRWTT